MKNTIFPFKNTTWFSSYTKKITSLSENLAELFLPTIVHVSLEFQISLSALYYFSKKEDYLMITTDDFANKTISEAIECTPGSSYSMAVSLGFHCVTS